VSKAIDRYGDIGIINGIPRFIEFVNLGSPYNCNRDGDKVAKKLSVQRVDLAELRCKYCGGSVVILPAGLRCRRDGGTAPQGSEVGAILDVIDEEGVVTRIQVVEVRFVKTVVIPSSTTTSSVPSVTILPTVLPEGKKVGVS
jgi:hypothetical protein